jgi:hypothetical protein
VVWKRRLFSQIRVSPTTVELLRIGLDSGGTPSRDVLSATFGFAVFVLQARASEDTKQRIRRRPVSSVCPISTSSEQETRTVALEPRVKR